ncbi:hypothetical protein CANARDRAFT_9842 [[Candida] arabinofermentans NRRL YB-2248]|uniref:Uncharacterized protein n=1 Tax=[Candida] arabinofermentans NRRL YB-2248 TaxID=983967 RepID=A0A1E4SUK8_9ASCO|nr:hypothetical protein CANARDRAFT_9842 [[Candida] arabinofermentans NRRL YB-2248]
MPVTRSRALKEKAKEASVAAPAAVSQSKKRRAPAKSSKKAVNSSSKSTKVTTRKMSSYKISQLKKKENLVTMSNRARPSYLGYTQTETKNINGPIKLSDQRSKIVINHHDLPQIKTNSNSNSNSTLNKLTLPKLTDDSILVQALNEIKLQLKPKSNESTGLLTNEHHLQNLDLNPFDKKLYTTYLKYHKQGNPHFIDTNPSSSTIHNHNCTINNGTVVKDESLIPNFYIDLNNIHGLRFKDLIKESERFDLVNMINEINTHPEDFEKFNDNTAFHDLNFVDIATIRKFNDYEKI